VRDCLRPVLEMHRGRVSPLQRYIDAHRRAGREFIRPDELDVCERLAREVHRQSGGLLDGADERERERLERVVALEELGQTYGVAEVALLRPLETAAVSGLRMHEFLEFLQAGAIPFRVDVQGRIWFQPADIRSVLSDISSALVGPPDA